MIILKIQSTISKIILSCLLIFTTLVLILMGQFYSEYYLFDETKLHTMILVGMFILVIGAGYFLARITADNKKLNISILLLMLLIFMVVATYWIKVVPNEQVSDFGNFWSRAQAALDGHALYETDNDYFAKYAYQSGYMAYVMLVVKIFGYHIFAIQFLNVIYQTLILLVTYLLVVKIFGNIKMARLSVLLLMVDLDWFALNSQADNQYLGSLFFLITFYLLMQDKLWAYILSGVTLTLGSIIRPIGPVIVAGIIVFALIYLTFSKQKFDYHKFSKLVLAVAIYFVLFALAGFGVKASGLNQYGLSNRDTEWKFVTGLNFKSDGTYTPDMDTLFDDNQTRDQIKVQEKKVIKNEIRYLNQHHKWLELFKVKIKGLWSQRTMATDSANFNKLHSDEMFQKVNFLAYVGSIILIVFSWLGSILLFKTKFNNYLYLLILPLMAFVVAQLLIEVQGRYRIEFLPIIAILASVGLFNLCQWIRRIFHVKSKGAVT